MMQSYKSLTPWQLEYLNYMKSLVPSLPPVPWNIHTIAPAAGIFAGGWTSESHFVLLSSDGYSIYDPINGNQTLFDRNVDAMFDNLSSDELSFQIPATSENIHVFGVNSGDGVHKANDWFVKTISPWWPNSMIILYKNSLSDKSRIHSLALEACDYGSWLKCGFSPSAKSLAILGQAGADFFSIED